MDKEMCGLPERQSSMPISVVYSDSINMWLEEDNWAEIVKIEKLKRIPEGEGE